MNLDLLINELQNARAQVAPQAVVYFRIQDENVSPHPDYLIPVEVEVQDRGEVLVTIG